MQHVTLKCAVFHSYKEAQQNRRTQNIINDVIQVIGISLILLICFEF